MIEELRVHGVGGIKDAQINFNGNFIVITGESGSGKSSLVRALEFIAGKRAQASNIHALEDASDVQMLLSADNDPGLSEEYQPQEGSLVVRRVFNRSGRGRCTIQESLIPLNILSSAMDREIVIQSQFAQLGLLEQSKQLELVDSCGGPELIKAKSELAATFNKALAMERGIMAIKKLQRETEDRFQDAETILRQVRILEIKADSEKLWENELKELDSKHSRSEALSLLSERFSGGAAGGGVLEELEKLCKDIYASAPKNEIKWQEYAEKMLSSAQDLAGMLQSEARDISSKESIEESREKLEKKLGIIRKLKRTLNLSSCSAILDYAEEATSKIAWLKESHTELASMEAEASRLKKMTSQYAIELRKLRKDAAGILASNVNRHLKDLAMEYAEFAIDILDQDKVRATGAENASFTLCLPDQKPLPVGKTASGGELSRILIALQLSLGDDKLPGTLVFDEVEAGLGGKTALLAGYKLCQLAKRCRTILITHEATIASMADQHFLVRRNDDDTIITEIKGTEREKEIARMLAGDETSHEAIEHARALLDNFTNRDI